MSERKTPWTPGPWHLGKDGFDRNRVWADKHSVAGLISRGSQPADLDPVAQANGRLIAAAPEMADALTAAWHALESYAHGNVATDLAEEIAAHCRALLARIGAP